MNLPAPLYTLISLMDKTHPDIRTYRIKDGQFTEIEFHAI